MMTRRSTLATLALCLFVAWPLAGQEETQEYESPEMAEMMEAYTKAGTPGAPHELLARTAGTWDVTVKMYMGPEPTVSEATSTIETIMGGRWSRETVEGSFMGQPFHGVGVTGYNNTAERYESTWYDNMSTTLYYYTGSASEDGKTLTFAGEFEDPATGEMVSQKTTLEFVSDGEMIARGFEDRGQGEQLVMELHYRRQM